MHVPDLWHFTWLWFIAHPWPLIFQLILVHCILTFHLIVVNCIFLTFGILPINSMVHRISLTFDISLDCGSLHAFVLRFFTWILLIAHHSHLIYYLLIRSFTAYPCPLIFHLSLVHWICLSFDISLNFCSLHILDFWYITYWFDRSMNISVLWYFTWCWFIGYPWSLIFYLTSDLFHILHLSYSTYWFDD